MAKSPTTPKPRAAKANPDVPMTYTAPHEVYTGGVLYPPGKPFTTAEPKGKEWVHSNPAEKAAAEAADPQNHQDTDLTKLDVGQLKAVAAARNIETGEVDSEPELIAIINAKSAPNG